MSRGNSLSGLTVQEIVQLVKMVVVKNQMPQQQQRGPVTYLLSVSLSAQVMSVSWLQVPTEN